MSIPGAGQNKKQFTQCLVVSRIQRARKGVQSENQSAQFAFKCSPFVRVEKKI